MWDLIVSVPDHCLSFYLEIYLLASFRFRLHFNKNTMKSFMFFLLCIFSYVSSKRSIIESNMNFYSNPIPE